MKKELIVICIPVFNEADNIIKLIKNLNSFINTNNFSDIYKFEVIFYDDGSTDKTSTIIEENSNFTVFSSKTNRGLGYAIDFLFKEAYKLNPRGLIKLDGDNQMIVKDIETFLQYELENDVDIIYGNRFSNSNKYKMPIFRKLGSTFFKYFLKIYSIKINDPTNGFLYVNSRYLEDYKIFGSYNAAQQILIDSKLRNLSIGEVPVNLQQRSTGRSFIGIKYPLIVISNILILTLYRSSVKFLLVPGILSLLFGVFLLFYDIYLWVTKQTELIVTNYVLFLFLIGGFQLVILSILFEFIKNRK
jgi:glycosyltransferase involved in cell wall biosynthesis